MHTLVICVYLPLLASYVENLNIHVRYLSLALVYVSATRLSFYKLWVAG